MKVFNHCSNFVLLTVCTFLVQIQANSDLCGDWHPYKDDWCYTILGGGLSTFNNAKSYCAESSEYDHSSMAMIRSKEEQDFLVNYVFKTVEKVDNFWIGAKYYNDTFHWLDNSTLGYTNWLKATRNKTDSCVQVLADEDWSGKWLDVPCTAKSLIVCQKVQWTRTRLEKAFDEAKHRRQVSLAEGNNGIQVQTEVISEANRTIEEAIQKIAQQKDKIEEANQKLTKHRDAIDRANEEFENQENRIVKSAKVLNILLFKGCDLREFVELNFNESTCSSTYCSLYREKLYKFQMKFVANQDSQTVHVKRMFGEDELKGTINEDGCKYVKCPLVKGKEYSFTVDKYSPVELAYGTKKSFQVTLTGDKGTLACSSLNVIVIGYDPSPTSAP